MMLPRTSVCCSHHVLPQASLPRHLGEDGQRVLFLPYVCRTFDDNGSHGEAAAEFGFCRWAAEKAALMMAYVDSRRQHGECLNGIGQVCMSRRFDPGLSQAISSEVQSSFPGVPRWIRRDEQLNDMIDSKWSTTITLSRSCWTY